MNIESQRSISDSARGVPGADGYPWWSDAVGCVVWGLIYFGWVPVALALGALALAGLDWFARGVTSP